MLDLGGVMIIFCAVVCWCIVYQFTLYQFRKCTKNFFFSNHFAWSLFSVFYNLNMPHRRYKYFSTLEAREKQNISQVFSSNTSLTVMSNRNAIFSLSSRMHYFRTTTRPQKKSSSTVWVQIRARSDAIEYSSKANIFRSIPMAFRIWNSGLIAIEF